MNVQTQYFTFATTSSDLLHLENGGTFGPVTIAYETHGELSKNKDNAILIFHALSGSHHIAGINKNIEGLNQYWTDECHLGWWNDFVGQNKAFDTRKYFVICANYFGSCYGSTGPASINPKTGKSYGGAFPVLTIGDVVNTQMKLIERLGIKKLLAVVGGSLGGVMATDLAMRYPDNTHCVISLASGPYATTLQKLANFEQIYAIEMDPNFNFGDYYTGDFPAVGLTLARMIAHKSFVHLQVMEDRARDFILQDENDLRGYRLQHQIESYILGQGKRFIKRFDANSYLRITNMWQQFDLRKHGNGSLIEAFRPCKNNRFLIFSIDSDVCFWPEEQASLCEPLRDLNYNYLHITVHSMKGHDSFLLEPHLYTPNIEFLLKETLNRVREK